MDDGQGEDMEAEEVIEGSQSNVFLSPVRSMMLTGPSQASR